MKKFVILPQGLTIIYFDNESRNIYAKISMDNGLAKKLSRRVFKDVMSELSTEPKKL